MNRQDQLDAVKSLLARKLGNTEIAEALEISRGHAHVLAMVATLPTDLQARFVTGNITLREITTAYRSLQR